MLGWQFDEYPAARGRVPFGKADQRLLTVERVVFQASEPGE